MAGLKERTLCIIKPDAVAKKAIGGIVAMIEDEGFDILGLRMTRLTMDDAMAFYVVHKERPFYGPLAQFMASGPIVAMVLEKEGAIADLRRLMGATDSRKAEEGTIRAKFGTDIERNAVHGSDSPESARFEIPFFSRRATCNLRMARRAKTDGPRPSKPSLSRQRSKPVRLWPNRA